MTTAAVKDVNRDGILDLLLSFDSRELMIEGAEATLEGRTSDGAPFRGSDAVEVTRVPARTSIEAAVDIPTRLALAVPLARGGLTLLVDLPSHEPAILEVFSVTGSRVGSQDLTALGPGRHRLQFNAGSHLPAGFYLLRLRQANAAVVARARVLH
jgi:hypothetical protein